MIKKGKAGKFMLMLRDIENIKRYQTRKMLFPRSVSEHTTTVTQIGYMLARWETSKFGNYINWEKLMGKLIFHDAIEAISGDILSPTKNFSADLKKEIEFMEIGLFEEKIRPILPKSWIQDMGDYMIDCKDESIEGKILAAADIIDVIFEARTEAKYINNDQNEFNQIIERSIDALMEIDLGSVRYFLKYALDDLDVYKHCSQKFRAFIKNVKFSEVEFENQRSAPLSAPTKEQSA